MDKRKIQRRITRKILEVISLQQREDLSPLRHLEKITTKRQQEMYSPRRRTLHQKEELSNVMGVELQDMYRLNNLLKIYRRSKRFCKQSQFVYIRSTNISFQFNCSQKFRSGICFIC
ncbi:hypothetical protein AVEN_197212-1 [Araneus ventricosus]|uniref:Uncharacterized protein n=1 Tax=Araneus ventricosus TaxID=182803 RepID=A0A4Y2GJE7_ARAVE|nr:hypothetical protein AVEN_197212-1 [Araneus ventricosus]